MIHSRSKVLRSLFLMAWLLLFPLVCGMIILSLSAVANLGGPYQWSVVHPRLFAVGIGALVGVIYISFRYLRAGKDGLARDKMGLSGETKP